MTKLLLRVGEAAEAIGISRTKTYELVRRGDLPAVQVGGSTRIPIGALEEWINKRTVSAANTDGSKEAGSGATDVRPTR